MRTAWVGVGIVGVMFAGAGCSSDASTATNTARCVTAGPAPNDAPLDISIHTGSTCDASATITVTNRSSAACASDVLGTLSDGTAMLFESESGVGGARGRWALRPAGMTGTGVIDYPLGDSTWPIDLTSLASGPRSFSIPITCGTTSTTVTGFFTVGQDRDAK